MIKQDTLILNSQIELLDKLLDWAKETMAGVLFDQDINQCLLLISESFSNAVLHAHKAKPANTEIEIKINVSSERVDVYVWDQGAGFDLEHKIARLSNLTLDPLDEGGRGLLIMSRLADNISYYKEQDGRNCLHIEKNLTPS